MSRPDTIHDRLVFGSDGARRHAKDFAHRNLHQQAAAQRARAEAFDLVLTWIDNGLPLHAPTWAQEKE